MRLAWSVLGVVVAGCGRLGFESQSAAPDAGGDAASDGASDPDVAPSACPTQLRLVDDFEGGLPAPEWQVRIGEQMSVTQVGGVVRFSFGQPSPAGAESSYRWNTPLDLRQGCLVAELVTVPANGGEAFIAIETDRARVRYKVESDKLVADDDTSSKEASYDATNHRFLRIRELAGTVAWETSATGVDFTPFHTATAPDLTSASVELGASTDSLVSGGAVEFAHVVAGLP